MTRVLFKSTPVARKKYTCNACEWIENEVLDNMYFYEFTYAELREIVKARRNGWQIMPGQRYIREVQLFEGRMYVFRAIPAINDICWKHEIYPLDWD